MWKQIQFDLRCIWRGVRLSWWEWRANRYHARMERIDRLRQRRLLHPTWKDLFQDAVTALVRIARGIDRLEVTVSNVGANIASSTGSVPGAVRHLKDDNGPQHWNRGARR